MKPSFAHPIPRTLLSACALAALLAAPAAWADSNGKQANVNPLIQTYVPGFGTTAYIGDGTGSNNTVSVTSTDYASSAAAGGASDESTLAITGADTSGTANTNTLTVESGAQVGYASGGIALAAAAATTAQADGNTLKILGEVDNAAGGLAAAFLLAKTASAKDNEVHIEGGTVTNNVYGGFVAAGTGDATGNHVFLVSGEVKGDVLGGKRHKNTSDEVSGNVLHVSARELTVGGEVKNFEELDITLPADIKDGEAMLRVGTNATFAPLLKKFTFAVDGKPALKLNSTIKLIAAGGALSNSGYPPTASGGGLDFNLSYDGQNLIAQVTSTPAPSTITDESDPAEGFLTCNNTTVPYAESTTCMATVNAAGYTFDTMTIDPPGNATLGACDASGCELKDVVGDVKVTGVFKAPPPPDQTPDQTPNQTPYYYYSDDSSPTLGELGLLLSGLALVGAAAPALRRREKQGKKADTRQ